MAELIDDETRVLLHLFRDGNDRNVVAVARAVRMDQSAVKYHLDRLLAAKLARLKVAQGHLYWGITGEGRRYVTERQASKQGVDVAPIGCHLTWQAAQGQRLRHR
jgi:predicted ArsR family transcriptional regulator